MQATSFYSDGVAFGQAAVEEDEDQWAGWSGRRASAETASTGFWGSWNPDSSHSDSGRSEAARQSQSFDGKWHWTPQMWVWGKTLDEGIQTCISKRWIIPDRAFCVWWGQQTTSEPQGSGSASCSSEARSRDFKQEACEKSEEGGGLEADEMPDENGSQTGKQSSLSQVDGKKPFTGKEHIPVHDGQISMREYVGRVKLFETNTSIHPSYRAGKLVEKLTGQAWTLDLASLRCDQGVEKLLEHLW